MVLWIDAWEVRPRPGSERAGSERARPGSERPGPAPNAPARLRTPRPAVRGRYPLVPALLPPSTRASEAPALCVPSAASVEPLPSKGRTRR